ncbi:MAG: hypothetical protein HKM95_11735 [Inquilinus sp.]|nr:hypothetical protein [Inquilinus sp.]
MNAPHRIAEPDTLSLPVRPTVVQILDEVAAHYGVTVAELTGRRRSRRVVWPRQMAMWTARRLTVHSLPSLGNAFARDHTTVMHGVAATAARFDALPETKEDAAAVLLRLQRRLTSDLHGGQRPAEGGEV